MCWLSMATPLRGSGACIGSFRNLVYIDQTFFRGPEEVKWELELTNFVAGKMALGLLELGFSK